jgi:hypothetical protein
MRRASEPGSRLLVQYLSHQVQVPLRVKTQGNNHFPGPHHTNTNTNASATCHNGHSFAGISAGRHSSAHVCVIVGFLTSLPPQYMTILKTCSCCIDVFHPAARHGKPGLEACHKFYSTVATHHLVAIWNSHVSYPLSQPQ